METFVFPDKNALAEAMACEVERFCILAGESGRSPSLALSGGSTPLGVFRALVGKSDPPPWGDVRVFWGDERCVPEGDERSNYGTARREFLEPLGVSPELIFPVMGERDPAEEARRYETLLRTTLPLEEGVPVFDWIWLGMGEDGHTVSVFPHQIALWDDPGCCAVARHPVLPETRITLTGRVINAARRVTFLVTGAAKAERVRDIIRGNGDGPRVPAALVNPRWGKLEFYMDREAASKL